MMDGKENEDLCAALIAGGMGSSYVARLHRRHELEKLRESVAGKAVSERLLRKSQSLRPGKGKSSSGAVADKHHPPPPLATIAAAEALLDDAALKLQRELDGYDKKLEALRNHSSTYNTSTAAGGTATRTAAASTANAPPKAPAAPVEQPIVRSVIAATGQGCKEVLASSVAAEGAATKGGRPASASAGNGIVWRTRSSAKAQAPAQSSCTLQLAAKRQRDVSIRITFAEAACVPAQMCFEHAPTPTAAFVALGRVPLQPKSMKQLKHVFRLGPDTMVDRCLRVTCQGHITTEEHAHVHSVAHLLVTGVKAASSKSKTKAGVAAAASEMATESVATFAQQTALEEEDTADSAAAGGGEGEEEEVQSFSLESAKKLEKGHKEEKEVVSQPPVAVAAAVEEQVESAAPAKKRAPPPPPPLPAAAAQGNVTVRRGGGRGGAAPPPPPPPPPKGAAAAGKADGGGDGSVTIGPAPSRPTLKLFWDKVQPRESAMGATVWGQLPTSSAGQSVDYALLEQEFAAKQPAGQKGASAGGTAAADQRKRPGRAGPQLVTMQRANNVGAMLVRLKLSPEQAQRALLRVLGDIEDEEREGAAPPLDLDAIESLMRCLPTEDERVRIAAYAGPIAELTPSERFLASCLPIPALQARLEAIVFLHGFDARAAGVEASAGAVAAAGAEARTSPLLRSVLKVALAIGNFLNAGNRNGAAAGFSVDALLKLRDVRSTRTRASTLLHFLARELERRHPEGASLTMELRTAKRASRIALGELRAELAALAEGVEAAHAAGCAGGADPEEMDELLAAATERLSEVNTAVMQADAAFVELRAFFNGKPSTMEEPSAFFGLLATFCAQLEVAAAENAAADAKAGGGGRAGREASTVAAAEEKEGGGEATPPLHRRDQVLATIRAYTRMPAAQRKALLTEKGARERLAALGIDHRHSMAAVGAGRAAVGEEEEQDAALRASCPVGALASLKKRGGDEEVAEEDKYAAAAEPSSFQAPEEEEARLEDAQHLPAPPMAAEIKMSTPVARLLEASRNVLESMHLHTDDTPSEGLAPTAAASPVEEESPLPPALAAEISAAEMSGSDLTDMPGGADHPQMASPSTSPVAPSYEEWEQEGMDCVEEPEPTSPVTLRPVVGDSNGFAPLGSPQATPSVAWGARSAKLVERDATVPPLQPEQAMEVAAGGGGSASANVTPEEQLLQCSSAAVRPVVPLRLWRSSDSAPLNAVSASAELRAIKVPPPPAPPAAAKEEEGYWGYDDDSHSVCGTEEAQADSSAVLAQSAATARPGGQSIGAAAAAAAEEVVQQETNFRNHHEEEDSPEMMESPLDSNPSLSQDQEEEEVELCCSAQWVAPTAAATHAPAAGAAATSSRKGPPVPGVLRSSVGAGLVAAARAAGGDSLIGDGGGVRRSSKRVSFSLPRSVDRASAAVARSSGAGSLRGSQGGQKPAEAAMQKQQRPQRSVAQLEDEPQRQRSNGTGSAATTAGAGRGDVGRSDASQSSRMERAQAASSLGLDLDLAKQLVRNASNVRRSRRGQETSEITAAGREAAAGETPAADASGGGWRQEEWSHTPQNHAQAPPPDSAAFAAGQLRQTVAFAGQQQHAYAATTNHRNYAMPPPQHERLAASTGGAASAPAGVFMGPSAGLREAPTPEQEAAAIEHIHRSLPAMMKSLDLEAYSCGVAAYSAPATSTAVPQLDLSHLNLDGLDLDGLMAAIIAKAGNTPTGPLARGVRQGDAQIFDEEAVAVLRAAAAARAAAGAAAGQPASKALLEPLVPAPLGLGVRVSNAVAEGISPLTLKENLEAHFSCMPAPTMVQMQHTNGGGGGCSQGEQTVNNNDERHHARAHSAGTYGMSQSLRGDGGSGGGGATVRQSSEERAGVDAALRGSGGGSSRSGGSHAAAAAAEEWARGSHDQTNNSHGGIAQNVNVSDAGGMTATAASQQQRDSRASEGGSGRSSQRQQWRSRSSARQVNSSLAGERLARWGSLPRQPQAYQEEW